MSFKVNKFYTQWFWKKSLYSIYLRIKKRDLYKIFVGEKLYFSIVENEDEMNMMFVAEFLVAVGKQIIINNCWLQLFLTPTEWYKISEQQF